MKSKWFPLPKRYECKISSLFFPDDRVFFVFCFSTELFRWVDLQPVRLLETLVLRSKNKLIFWIDVSAYKENGYSYF